MIDDDAVGRAIAASHLASLPTRALDELTAPARLHPVRAGTLVHREGPVAPHFTLVVSGLVRVYVAAPDGRTMTVRALRDLRAEGLVQTGRGRIRLLDPMRLVAEWNTGSRRREPEAGGSPE